MAINLLLTSVGGLVSPGIIQDLRSMPEAGKIVGINASTDAIGFHFVDKAFVVPNGDTKEYIPQVTEIIEREGIGVVIPCSDEEVLSFSRYRTMFAEKGVKILCSSPEVTETALDKAQMLFFLKNKGLPVPKFYLPEDRQDIFDAAKQLGYSSRPVVVKPRRARGGRGFRFLCRDVDVLFTRGNTAMKLEWYAESIRDDEVHKILLMEYLSGDDYSVDALASSGKPLAIVPRKRIRSILGPSQLGEVDLNGKVLAMVEQVIEAFGFDSNVNIQLRFREKDQIPLVYEINPRVSGTIVASGAAGVNLLKAGVRLARGLEPKKFHVPQEVTMIRYLSEYFIKK